MDDVQKYKNLKTAIKNLDKKKINLKSVKKIQQQQCQKKQKRKNL